MRQIPPTPPTHTQTQNFKNISKEKWQSVTKETETSITVHTRTIMPYVLIWYLVNGKGQADEEDYDMNVRKPKQDNDEVPASYTTLI